MAQGGDINSTTSELFTALDLNNDGQISRDEWAAAFSTLDDDGDGNISRKEWHLHGGPTEVFDAVPRRNVPCITQQEWLAAFDLFDHNKNGFIELAEWHGGATCAAAVGQVAVEVNIFGVEAFNALSNFIVGFGFWADTLEPPFREWWPSAEHFLQAGKFADPALQQRVREAAEPGIAKALGRSLSPLRPDWDRQKHSRLRHAMLEKLWAHKTARDVLLGIPDDARIINGNPADPFFGIGPTGSGEDAIGKVLQDLRSFFTVYRERRRLRLKIADVGWPHEPFYVAADATGASPGELVGLAAAALGLPVAAVMGVQLLTDDGFDKTEAEEFPDAAALEAFLEKHSDDVDLEVQLADACVVTLWDREKDAFLGKAELRHLCKTPEAVVERLKVLMPVMRYDAFRPTVDLCVDGGDAIEWDAEAFARAVAAADEGSDVLISVSFTVPLKALAPILPRPRPEEYGPPAVVCGDHTSFSASNLRDRILGVIWGSALGDAVGLATEFMKKEDAARQYPDPSKLSPTHRIEDRHRSRWKAGDWTDDTDQMVLMLDAVVAGNGILDQRKFAETLRSWRDVGYPELGDTAGLGIGQTVNGVLEHAAYGVAPDVAADIVWRESACTAAANGAIMRCAGSAMAYFWEEEVLTYNAAAGAVVTHTDPRCVASCVAVVSLLSRILMGADTSTLEKRLDEVSSALSQAEKHLAGGNADELWRATRGVGPNVAALELGSGGIGYTYKALSATCWAFLYATSFRDAITTLTLEAGDADSNAVVAGAVLGAVHGYSQLPRGWLDEVPDAQRAWLNEKASAMLRLLGLSD